MRSHALHYGLGVLLLTLGSLCWARVTYSPPFAPEATEMWTHGGTVLKCSLNYDIRDFGQAEFISYAGREIKTGMILHTYRDILVRDRTKIRFIASRPEWTSDTREYLLGSIFAYPGFEPVLGPRLARELLYQLNNGNQILMPFLSDNYVTPNLIVPIISPQGFKKHYEDFVDCSRKLLSVNFSDIEYVPLVFKYRSPELNSTTLKYFREMIDYVNADSAVTKIEVRAYAYDMDSAEENEELAGLRASYIHQALIDAGIGEQLISMVPFNQQFQSNPVSSLPGDHDPRMRNGMIVLERDDDNLDYDLELDRFPDEVSVDE